jgi:dTDP-4-amino-4,6-dideoxygalactose transaminase
VSARGLKSAFENPILLYQKHLGTLPGIGFQLVHPGNRCSYKDFSITIDKALFGLSRDELALALAADNIDSRKYYHPPVHCQTAYRSFAPAAEALSTTAHLAATSLSLPIWSHMKDEMVHRICHVVQSTHRFSIEIKKRLANATAVSVA